MPIGSARGTFPRPLHIARSSKMRAFAVGETAIVPRPTVLPTGIEPRLDDFAEDFLGAIPLTDRLRARGEVAELLRPVLVDETGSWVADYVRLRFRAVRPQ